MFHRNARKNSLGSGVRALIACLIVFQFNVALASRDVDEPSPFARCWNYKSSPDLSIAIATDTVNVYFLSTDQKIEAVDLRTAAKVWSSELGGDVASNMLVTSLSVFVVTRTTERGVAKSRLWALSKQTGIPIWSVDIASSSRFAVGELSGNIVVVGFDGVTSAYTREKGEASWTSTLAGTVTSEPQFTADEVIFGTDNAEVISLGGDGKKATLARLKVPATAVFLDSERRLMTGDTRGNIMLTSPDGTTIWKFRNGARIAFVLAYDSEYLAGSNDNFIYKLTRGGNVEWKRRLSGRVGPVPELIGDIAITSVVGEGSVFVLNLRNGKILNRIESGEETSPRIKTSANGPGFLVAGPSGIAYYTMEGCALAKAK